MRSPPGAPRPRSCATSARRLTAREARRRRPMPAICTWLRQPAAQAVGWALLQFVWQGAAVGALTAVALLALRRSASDVRYVVAPIGLGLMLTLPIVTGAQRYQALRAEGDASLSAPAAAAGSDFVRSKAHATALTGQTAGARSGSGESARSFVLPRAWAPPLRALRAEALLPTLMLAWLAGVSILSLRLFTGWLWVQRLRTRGVLPAGTDLQRMAARLARRLHITRAVTLLESTLVDVPTVIGFLTPVVL